MTRTGTDLRRDRHVSTETDIYSEGLAAGIADKPSVAPEIYPHMSNDWQLCMDGHANGTKIMNALALAETALEHSKPAKARYSEPVEPHHEVLAAIREARSQ